jgi:hypothetical protein
VKRLPPLVITPRVLRGLMLAAEAARAATEASRERPREPLCQTIGAPEAAR